MPWAPTTAHQLEGPLACVYRAGLCPPDWDPLQAALSAADKLRRCCSPALCQEVAAVRSGSRPQSQLHRVTEWAQRLTEASGVAIALDDGEKLECVARSGSTAPELGSRLEPQASLSGRCARTGEIQASFDTEADDAVDIHAARMLGVRSVIIVPIIQSADRRGILAVFSSASRKFGADDVLALVFLAALATKVTAGTPIEQQRDQPDIAMLLPAEKSRGMLMKALEDTEYAQHPAGHNGGGRLRVSTIAAIMLSGLLCGAVGGFLAYRFSQTRASQSRPASPVPVVSVAPDTRPAARQINTQSVEGKMRVVIGLDRLVAYDAHRLDQPDRVYLDLHDAHATPELAGKTIFVNSGGITTIRTAQTQPDTLRIVVDLDKRFDYSVTQQANPATLLVQLTPALPPSARRKQKPAKPESPAPQQ